MKFKVPDTGNTLISLYDLTRILESLGFKIVRENGAYTYMRKGNIHLTTRIVFEGIEVDIHEDRGKGPHHQVINKNRKLVKLKQKILETIEEHKKIKEEELKMIFSWEKIQHPPEAYYCPFHKECPYFKKENLLCTLQSYSKKYCDEYRRRAKYGV